MQAIDSLCAGAPQLWELACLATLHAALALARSCTIADVRGMLGGSAVGGGQLSAASDVVQWVSSVWAASRHHGAQTAASALQAVHWDMAVPHLSGEPTDHQLANQPSERMLLSDPCRLHRMLPAADSGWHHKGRHAIRWQLRCTCDGGTVRSGCRGPAAACAAGLAGGRAFGHHSLGRGAGPEHLVLGLVAVRR